MIIASSSIGMDSARTYTSVSREAVRSNSSLFINLMDDKAQKNEDSGSKIKKEGDSSKNEILNDAQSSKQSFDDIYSRIKTYMTSSAYEDKLEKDQMNKIKVQCIQYLLLLLFGNKGVKDNSEISLASSELLSQSGGGQIAYKTVEESYMSFQAESETTEFSTQGIVKTSDGREIEFNLNLSMSRQFVSYMEEHSSYTTAFVDPLVINLDTDAASVEDVKISFDIDFDGENEEISRLSAGSGYLAIDKNNDGIINDGSELFGTSSGDGFYDLSEYDIDGNGWIDEADEVFDKLKICVLNDDGSQSLYKLKDKGVGAICLKNVDTDFSLNNLESNKTNAKIRKTGIFLYENGGVGTVQHLDLAQ